MDFTIQEIGIEALDLSIATCAFRVWEESTRRLGLDASPEKILAKWRETWPDRMAPVILIVRSSDGEVVGYRFTYALPDENGRRVCLDEGGGVHPDYRRQGIGRALLREQHRIAKDRGYARIKTGVALPLRPMIILNLQEGFEITGLEDVKGDGWMARCLMFEKKL